MHAYYTGRHEERKAFDFPVEVELKTSLLAIFIVLGGAMQAEEGEKASRIYLAVNSKNYTTKMSGKLYSHVQYQHDCHESNPPLKWI